MILVRYITTILIVAIVIIGYVWFTNISIHAQKPGIVILLNGASASGKSTLQKELQKLFPTPYLGIGLDTFFVGVLPERFVIGPRLDNDVPQELIMQGVVGQDAEGHRLFTLEIGDIGDHVMRGMHHAIAAYAKQGNNCIIDYIAYKKEWITDLCDALKDVMVYVIGVDCPIETLETREKARGRAFVEGHARSHYKTVHENIGNRYDLRVNTDTMNAPVAAQFIYDYIVNHPKPIAFKTLCKWLII